MPPNDPPPPPIYAAWENEQGAVRFAAAPYTFVEGCLKLAGDLEKDNGVKPK